MTTFTIFADTNDGYIACDDGGAGNYASARAGTATLTTDIAATSMTVGQFNNTATFNQVAEGFLSFDTSAIGSGAVISTATLSLYAQSLWVGPNYAIEARAYDWGSGLTSADFVAGASLSALTFLASIQASMVTVGAYNALTSAGAFLAAINVTGPTRIILDSSRTVAGSAPSTNEQAQFYTSDASGTSQDPKLVIDAVANLSMAAGLGTYSIAGQPAVLVTGARLAAIVGTFTIAGQAANLINSAANTNMSAAVGVFALSGQPAALTVRIWAPVDPPATIWTPL